MNFDFSDDQRRLQEEVRRVLGARSTSADVRRVLEGEEAYAAGTWRQLADLGALGIALPEADGGAGLGLLELCLVAEEAGRALAAVPLLPSIYLAAEAIRRAGNAAQRAAWLPGIAGGAIIATAALAVPAHHVFKPEPVRLDGDRVSGTINAVPDGMAASVVVVLAGGRLVCVQLDGPGVARSAQASLDPTRPLARIAFDNAPGEVLAHGDATVAAQVMQGAAVLLAFEQIGGAERALYAARDYALERRAFGRVIGGFQAVRHALAALYADIELARAHAYFGAWALSSDAPELPRAAAAARVAASDAYNATAEESLHLHGGIGYTWEVDCHLHLRRARWIGQILGTRHLWADRLAAELIAEAA